MVKFAFAPGREGTQALLRGVMVEFASARGREGTRAPCLFRFLSARTLNNEIREECIACPVGTFSLGGGLSLQGSLGDWKPPWPVQVTSDCLYRDELSAGLGAAARAVRFTAVSVFRSELS